MSPTDSSIRGTPDPSVPALSDKVVVAAALLQLTHTIPSPALAQLKLCKVPNPWRGHPAVLHTHRGLPEVVVVAPNALSGDPVTICITNLGTEPFTLQQERVVGTVEPVGLVQPTSPCISMVQDHPSWNLPECPPHLSKVE